jgi:diadenosine tetraphosphate (Ap4A) HIT family hydrolase
LAVAYIGIKLVGEDVPHAHVHLIPFNYASDYHKQADMTAEPDHADLAALAERLVM